MWKKIRQVTEGKRLRFSSAHGKCPPDGGVFIFSEMSGGEAQAVGNGDEDNRSNDRCRRLRLSLQDQHQAGYTPEGLSGKMMQSVNLSGSSDLYSPAVSDTLSPLFQTAESVRMITDEVSQIQEVRYCLKTLREQMAARQNSNNNKYPANGFRVDSSSRQPAVSNGNAVLIESHELVAGNREESAKLREVTKRLYAQLKEMEKRHQEERERLQAESDEYHTRLVEQSEQLHKAEERSEERGLQVDELQRLLGSMEIESGALKDKMAAGEAELLQLKASREEGAEEQRRCAELEKEVATLKEKIHHLDDMLKCQQRKVRHMIEQLQNSRTVIQERDRVIGDLEERVAFLQAENREMHDHMEYFLAGQDPPPLTSTQNKPEVVYSKALTPTTQTNKALPFIKVIEIKS
uniref:Tuftelin-like n=1 Tax=Scophthalmus maximus TaxID=52904 RepID=A0A8D2ZPG3_SCOMX